jgi:hypothetical protein
MAKKNTKLFSDYIVATSLAKEITVPLKFIGDEEELKIKVRNYMTVDEKRLFINRVANSCFDEDDNYNPEMRDTVFQITILQMLTDAPVFTKKIDEIDEVGEPTGKKVEIIDIDKTYELCKCLGLYNKIEDVAFHALCAELSQLIAEKIVFNQQRILMGEKRVLERTKAEMEDGIALINSVGETLNKTMRDSFSQGDIIKATNDLSKRMNNMSDKELLESILGK